MMRCGAPLQAALEDLNSRMPESIPINRFRPNIVLSGAGPWAEDTWRHLKLVPGGDAAGQPEGCIELTACKPCSRCVRWRWESCAGGGPRCCGACWEAAIIK